MWSVPERLEDWIRDDNPVRVIDCRTTAPEAPPSISE